MKHHLFSAPLLLLLLAQCASDAPPPRYPGQTAYLNSPGAPIAPNYTPVNYAPASPPVYGYPPQVQRPASQPYYQPQPMPLMFESASNLGTNAPYIRAESYILVNANNGSVLAAKNADSIRGVASTQKVLTALIVAEAGDLDRPVQVVASDVAVEPSKLGVKAGEVYTRRQLLIAFLVKSSNDVANVLARDNAGSVSAFAARMTARARSLGATQSSFRNAHGLTASGQYSTARDMSRIAMVAYNNPVIRDAVRRRYYTFRYASGRTVTLENTNDLLGLMPECNGMKTGYTAPAGRCLISTARGRRDVILVQLGTRTKYIWDDGAALMRWGLNQ